MINELAKLSRLKPKLNLYTVQNILRKVSPETNFVDVTLEAKGDTRIEGSQNTARNREGKVCCHFMYGYYKFKENSVKRHVNKLSRKKVIKII